MDWVPVGSWFQKIYKFIEFICNMRIPKGVLQFYIISIQIDSP